MLRGGGSRISGHSRAPCPTVPGSPSQSEAFFHSHTHGCPSCHGSDTSAAENTKKHVRGLPPSTAGCGVDPVRPVQKGSLLAAQRHSARGTQATAGKAPPTDLPWLLAWHRRDCGTHTNPTLDLPLFPVSLWG